MHANAKGCRMTEQKLRCDLFVLRQLNGAFVATTPCSGRREWAEVRHCVPFFSYCLALRSDDDAMRQASTTTTWACARTTPHPRPLPRRGPIHSAPHSSTRHTLSLLIQVRTFVIFFLFYFIILSPLRRTPGQMRERRTRLPCKRGPTSPLICPEDASKHGAGTSPHFFSFYSLFCQHATVTTRRRRRRHLPEPPLSDNDAPTPGTGRSPPTFSFLICTLTIFRHPETCTNTDNHAAVPSLSRYVSAFSLLPYAHQSAHTQLRHPLLLSLCPMHTRRGEGMSLFFIPIFSPLPRHRRRWSHTPCVATTVGGTMALPNAPTQRAMSHPPFLSK